MNRLTRVSFAKIPAKFGATDWGFGVMGLFEKVTENWRQNIDWTW